MRPKYKSKVKWIGENTNKEEEDVEAEQKNKIKK